MQQAVAKIENEVLNNIKELNTASSINQMAANAYRAYEPVYNGTSAEVKTTSEHMSELQLLYEGYFTITDSTILDNDTTLYEGSTFIQLELPELTEIAWTTAKSIGITSYFNYECLYELESMYNLQRRVKDEMDNAAAALQNSEMRKLMNSLHYVDQFESELKVDYENMLSNIRSCIN